jgi:hypothetical protein
MLGVANLGETFVDRRDAVARFGGAALIAAAVPMRGLTARVGGRKSRFRTRRS